MAPKSATKSIENEEQRPALSLAPGLSDLATYKCILWDPQGRVWMDMNDSGALSKMLLPIAKNK